MRSTKRKIDGIHGISNAAVPSSRTSTPDTRETNRSTSRIAERLGRSVAFWHKWLRQPSVDVAEAVLRLRRLREMTQSDLAAKVGTKQPAIARIESGKASVSTGTLVKLAEALGSTVRIQMEPMELIDPARLGRSWWEQAARETSTAGAALSVVINIVQNNYISPGPLGERPEGRDIEEAEYEVLDAEGPVKPQRGADPTLIS